MTPRRSVPLLAAWLTLGAWLTSISGCCPYPLLKAQQAADDAGLSDLSAQQKTGPTSIRPTIIEEVLDNGLHVYMLEDHSAPLVSYQVWFKVGSVNEREAAPGEHHGITGLSHFFEHMMFRGTEKHPKFFDEIYSLGGKLNAFTWLDETVYWENLPSEHLKSVIGMEADRLEHMKIDFLNLEPEREVVKSERLLRTENSAEGMAWEVLQSRVFRHFPYHWGTIGWMRDLNAVTVEEAQAYHATYYAPNNAYIIVSGDHDPAQTLAWIKAAYGHLKARDIPAESWSAEPTQKAERRDKVIKPVKPPQVLWAYRSMAPKDPDFAVLEVLDHILTQGKSSRLQQKLVHSQNPRVGRLYAYLMPIRHPYLYLWGANLQPDMTVHELEESVDAEIQSIIDDGVTQEELKRAVAGLRSDLVRQNLSNQKNAEFIGFSLRATDSPYTFLDRLDTYGEITVADIQRVAKDMLRPTNRTVVPVVSPDRLSALTASWVDAMPTLPPQASGALKEAVAILLERDDLARESAGLDEEARAIKLLQQRAEGHLEGSDEPTQKAIKAYLESNEKGTVKRLELLNAARAQLEARQGELAERQRKAQKDAKQLKRMRWNPGVPPASMVLSVVHEILGMKAAGKKKPKKRKKRAEFNPTFTLAQEVIMAWLRESQGQMAAANAHRQRAIKLGQVLLGEKDAQRDPSSQTLLKLAFALAWDTQQTGLDDEPPQHAETGQGGRS